MIPDTYVKKIQEKDIDGKQCPMANILTAGSIKHSLIPFIGVYNELAYEMEYIDGENLYQLFRSYGQKKRRTETFKLVGKIATLIEKMSQLENESYPNHMFMGKDMRNLGNYMMRKDGRILCIDFDSWKWWPREQAIWHARNALAWPVEELLIS